MEKKIYFQPKTKVLSIADYCEPTIDNTSDPISTVYGPDPGPFVEPVEDPAGEIFK